MTNEEKLTKAVTPAVLEEFYNSKLAPYLNNQIPTFANAFSRGDIIDTTERIVGMFIGKPMYQKVVDCGALPNADLKSIAHNISNLERIVDNTIIMSDGTTFAAIPFTNYHSGNDNGIFYYITKTAIGIRATDNRSSYTAYAILRYTKTTDTANAIKYGTGNDYSLDEQIVGTWIDGKPLYQKSINFGALPDGSSEKRVAHGINNLDLIIDAYGLATNGSEYILLPTVKANAQNQEEMTFDKTNIKINSTRDRSVFTAYITLQYTKTTD